MSVNAQHKLVKLLLYFLRLKGLEYLRKGSTVPVNYNNISKGKPSTKKTNKKKIDEIVAVERTKGIGLLNSLHVETCICAAVDAHDVECIVLGCEPLELGC